MEAGHSGHLRNGPACKDIWSAVFGDFKRINDCQKGTGHNEEYWDVSLQGRMQWNLPRQFSREVYGLIGGFMGRRPFFAPHILETSRVLKDTVYTPITLSEDTNDREGPQLMDPTYFPGVESGDDTFLSPRRVAASPRSTTRVPSPTTSGHHPPPVSLDSTSSQPAGLSYGKHWT